MILVLARCDLRCLEIALKWARFPTRFAQYFGEYLVQFYARRRYLATIRLTFLTKCAI